MIHEESWIPTDVLGRSMPHPPRNGFLALCAYIYKSNMNSKMDIENKGYAVDIQAPWYLLWGMLVENIKHPDRFLHVMNVKIVGEGAGYVNRSMELGGRTFREHITWDESRGTVKIASSDGTDLTVWHVLTATDQPGIYNLRFCDTNLDGSEDAPGNAAIPADYLQGGVERLKAQAEKLAKESVPVAPIIQKTRQIVFFCLVDLAPGKTTDDIDEHLNEHLEYLTDLEKKGLVEQHGPMLNHAADMTGRGAYIIRTAVPGEADHIAREDPLARSGTCRYQLLPWAKTPPQN